MALTKDTVVSNADIVKKNVATIFESIKAIEKEFGYFDEHAKNILTNVANNVNAEDISENINNVFKKDAYTKFEDLVQLALNIAATLGTDANKYIETIVNEYNSTLADGEEKLYISPIEPYVSEAKAKKSSKNDSKQNNNNDSITLPPEITNSKYYMDINSLLSKSKFTTLNDSDLELWKSSVNDFLTINNFKSYITDISIQNRVVSITLSDGNPIVIGEINDFETLYVFVQQIISFFAK